MRGRVVLNNFSEEIRQCLQHAVDCARQAAAQSDDLRSPFLCFSSPKAAREPTYRAEYNSTNDPQKSDG